MADDLRTRIHKIYLDYMAGRLDLVLGNFADDVEFICYAPAHVLPYFGRRSGKADLAARMLEVQAEFEHLNFMPKALLVDGDNQGAAAIIEVRFKQRSSGRLIEMTVAHFARFRGGKVVEVREFIDSFDAIQQALGSEIVVPNAIGARRDMATRPRPMTATRPDATRRR